MEYKPKSFLFEGQFGGPYHLRSAQAVFKNAMKAAGVNKQIGIHGLRHSYVPHIYWNMERIYRLFKNCWGIMILKQRFATRRWLIPQSQP
ncbi:hypothetical protein A8C56_23485 [Niabella ginsenosidivorans]|uniref:Tyr recombinase domain-containing protein n=1 Tax=Niabella ginsenosidivorans TaxID=1176587 RepID=A0A1A9IA42_9BACT|nr:hypothetical protein A8C56_23485 [Niabella ginsenosidivorans]